MTNNPDIRSEWAKANYEEHYDYYRNTVGGRQTLTKAKDGYWELNQEGYLTVLHRSKDYQECVLYANNFAPIENLRISNMTAYEFAQFIYENTAYVLKCLVSGSEDAADEGLKEVARIEAYLLILRTRLNDRCSHQTLAARAEEVTALMLKNVGMFYGEQIFGELDGAANRLEAIKSVVAEMEEELKKEAGDPGRRS